MPTQQELDLYAQTLCSLKTISDFLSTIKCNSDGSFTIKTNNGECCISSEVFNLENTLNIVYATISQEALTDIENIGVNVASDIQPIIDALQCACQAVNSIYSELLNNLPIIQNGLDTIDNQIDQLDQISNDIDTNTDPIQNIEQLLTDIIAEVNEPYVVRIIPVTEYLSGITDRTDWRFYGGIYNYSGTENKYGGLFFLSYPPAVPNNFGNNTDPNTFDYSGGRRTTGRITRQGDAVSSTSQYNVDNPPLFFVTGIQGCNQTLVKLWSDGSVTDLSNTPVDPTTLQDNIGWCRSGLIPNAWNTPYTVV